MRADYKNRIYLFLLAVISLHCHNDTGPVVTSPDGYNMKTAVQIKLPLELDEISGVAFYAPDSSIFAINDEKGWLYKIKRGQEIQRWKFSKGADFEDVVLLDSMFYVLQSNGNIIRLSFETRDTLSVKQYYFSPSGDSKNEFEILYSDPGKKKLILICKDCETDKKKSLTTFTFDPLAGTYSDSSFSINVQAIEGAMGEEKLSFKPSAAAINPTNGLLYIISANNKMLVITDVN